MHLAILMLLYSIVYFGGSYMVTFMHVSMNDSWKIRAVHEGSMWTRDYMNYVRATSSDAEAILSLLFYK